MVVVLSGVIRVRPGTTIRKVVSCASKVKQRPIPTLVDCRQHIVDARQERRLISRILEPRWRSDAHVHSIINANPSTRRETIRKIDGDSEDVGRVVWINGRH